MGPEADPKNLLEMPPLRSQGSVLLLFVANGDISLALTPDIKENGISDFVGWQLFAVDIKSWFYDRTSQPTVFCIERSLVPSFQVASSPFLRHFPSRRLAGRSFPPIGK